MLKNISRMSQNKMNLRIELNLLEVNTKKEYKEEDLFQIQWKRGPQTDCSETFRFEDMVGKMEKSL